MHPFAFVKRLGVVLIVLVGAGQAEAGDDAQASSDGWRRTAQGWERIEAWRHASRTKVDFLVSDESAAAPAVRWDVHPALLVALQGLAIALAFAVFQRSPTGSMAKQSAISGGQSSLDPCDAQAHAA